MPSGSIGKVISIVTGLTCGGIFGIYMAQNYEVPDVGEVVSKVQDKINDYEKPNNKTGKDD